MLTHPSLEQASGDPIDRKFERIFLCENVRVQKKNLSHIILRGLRNGLVNIG